MECPDGQSSGGGGSTGCYNCNPNQYSNGNTNRQCVDCPAGTYSGSGWGSCAFCAQGFISAAGRGCTQCPYGTVSSNDRQRCDSCPAGTYSDNYELFNTGRCSNCGAGSFSTGGTRGCTLCAVGRYSGSGAGGCPYCRAGSTTPGQGFSSCSTCTPGSTALASSGLTTCTACPAGTGNPLSQSHVILYMAMPGRYAAYLGAESHGGGFACTGTDSTVPIVPLPTVPVPIVMVPIVLVPLYWYRLYCTVMCREPGHQQVHQPEGQQWGPGQALLCVRRWPDHHSRWGDVLCQLHCCDEPARSCTHLNPKPCTLNP